MPDRNLLVESAPLAHAYAKDHCWHPDGTLDRCSWYHGLWQYLRLLGIVSSPEIHAQFFRDTLGSLAKSGDFRRVLVCGTADYAMLEHVLDAYQEEAKTASITVSDRCPTPLHLCEWYAAKRSVTIQTQACDAVALTSPTPFDLICNHCFLSNITADNRPALLRAWRDLLRPGGLVVTINRIRPPESGDSPSFSAAKAAEFAASTRKAAKAHSDLLDLSPDVLEAMAGEYARRIAFDPIRSTEELRSLFEDNGFRLEVLEPFAPVDPAARTTPAGPTAPGGALYMKIIAARI